MIRVQVAGQFGVPGNAAAAVLNVTGVNSTAPGFVTVYPAGTDLPTASNINFDRAGQIMANMVTVKLGTGGAVDVYTQQPMDLVVDVSGAYVPVSGLVANGRLVTRADGAFRVLDTRPFGVAPGSIERVDVGAAGVPADAVAVVVNLTATETGLGFWTAFPLGQSVPNASNLNIDTPGQTRAGQAIVLLSGIPSFNVFSQGGGQLIVDVAGYFTGSKARSFDRWALLPGESDPPPRFAWHVRHADVGWQHTRVPGVRASRPGLGGGDQHHRNELDDRWLRHRIPVGRHSTDCIQPQRRHVGSDGCQPCDRASQHPRHQPVHAAGSAHDRRPQRLVSGAADARVLPPPTNPAYGPTTAESVHTPSIGMALPVGLGADLDAVANLGIAATWNGTAQLATPGNIVLFGHRTTHGAPFLNIDSVPLGGTIALVGDDGHVYTYMVVRQDVTAPNFNTINNIGLRSGLATVQLVACTPPHSVRFRWVTTARLISVA